jgi:hypothetical protein
MAYYEYKANGMQKYKLSVFWDAAPCSLAIALMMEAASTSETSVNFYQTSRCNIPEDSHLQSYLSCKYQIRHILLQNLISLCLVLLCEESQVMLYFR